MKTVFSVLMACFLVSVALGQREEVRPALLRMAQQVQENPRAEGIGNKYLRNFISAPEWAAEMPLLLQRIAESGNVNLRSPSGFTALQAACVYGNEADIRLLLAAGADVNARPAAWKKLGLAGNAPIGMLVCYMDEESAERRIAMAKLLLDAGADPDAPIAAWKEEAPFEELRGHAYNDGMRQLLLSYGNQDMKQRTKEWYLAWRWYSEAVIRKLLDGGVDPNSNIGEKGYTLLAHLLCRGEDAEFIRYVIEKGASVKGTAGKGYYTPPYAFMIPASSPKCNPENAVAILRVLLDNGASIDALDASGESLRIHYGRYNTPAARAIGAELRARGARLHPDAK